MSEQIIANRYVLLDKIGEGGMGVVYRSEDRLTHNIVALKSVVDPEFKLSVTADESEARSALAREFKTLASLRHPHIISVLDYGFDSSGHPFFTMNLLEDTQDVLEAGHQATVSGKIQLLIEILQALTYLHRRGILHRDLKPANVLVSNNQVKLLDFGLASRQGKSETIAGTVSYIAPEVIRGNEITPAADLYAVGLIAYELFVGHHPFETNSITHLIHRILTEIPDLQALIDPEYIRQIPDGDIVGLDETWVAQTATLIFNYDLQQTDDTDELPRAVEPNQTVNSLAEIIGQLLAKSPEDRYQSAQDVIQDLCAVMDYPLPEETKSIRDSFIQAAAFVGREYELSQLLTDLKSAKSGAGNAWLIGGESGVGKSRLLDELRTQSLIEGAVVIRGQGISSGSNPYQIWGTVLRMMLLQVDLPDDVVDVLKTIMGDVDTQDSAIAQTELAQIQLFNAVEALFQAQTQPLVILLEDLQWARTEDINLLERVLPLVPKLPILLVGSYRTDDKLGFPTLLNDQKNLPDILPQMKLMYLERFTANETVQLATSILGEAGYSADLLDLLQRQAEGNVFFLVETVRALAENAGSLDNIQSSKVPEIIFTDGIFDLVRRRLSRVPLDYQELLKLAAVIGRQIDTDLLPTLNEKIDFDSWLTVCSEESILEADGDSWRFVHDKIREGLLIEIPPAECQILHRRVAEATEHTYIDLGQHAAALAHYYYIARDHAKETEYLLMAGEQSLKNSAYREAVYYFQRILDIATDDVLHQAQVSCKLGKAFYELRDYEKSQSYYEQGLAMSLNLGSSLGVAEAQEGLAWIAVYKGDLEMAETFFKDNLERYTEQSDQMGLARNYNGLGEVARRRGDFTEAVRCHQQSLAIEEAINNQIGVAFAYHFLGVTTRSQGELNQAMEYFNQSLALRRQFGDRAKISVSLGNVGIIAYLQGDYGQAEPIFEECLDIMESVGNRQGSAIMLSYLGRIALLQEKIDLAVARFREAINLTTEMQAIPAQLQVLIGIARLYWLTGKQGLAIEIWQIAATHPQTSVEDKQEAYEYLAKAHVTISTPQPDVDLNGYIDQFMADYTHAP